MSSFVSPHEKGKGDSEQLRLTHEKGQGDSAQLRLTPEKGQGDSAQLRGIVRSFGGDLHEKLANNLV